MQMDLNLTLEQDFTLAAIASQIGEMDRPTLEAYLLQTVKLAMARENMIKLLVKS